MKNFVKLSLFLLFLIGGGSAASAGNKVGDTFTNSEGSFSNTYTYQIEITSTASVTKHGKGKIKKITEVGSKFDGKIAVGNSLYGGVWLYDIVEIDANCFGSNTSASIREKIKEADLLNAVNLTKIGDYAFDGCQNMTQVYINDNLETLGKGVFRNCTSLSDVRGGLDREQKWYQGNAQGSGTYIAQALPLSIKNIPDETFRGCTALTSFQINGAATSIGAYAFSSTGLTSLGYYNFDSGNSMITSPDGACYLPQSCTTIGDYAFAGSKISNINMENTKLKTIGNGAFRSCSNLSKINYYVYNSINSISTSSSNYLPNSLTSIGNMAFEFCPLTTVNMYNNVTSIGNYCFDQCTKLSSVTLSSGLTTIPTRAFNQTALTYINLKNVTTVDQMAFSETKLTSLNATNMPKVKVIGTYAFSKITTLKTVDFPSTVESIGAGAFDGSDNIVYFDFTAINKDATASSASGKLYIQSTALNPSTLASTARVFVPFGHESSYYSAASTSGFSYKPIIGGGTVNNILANGLCDNSKHYYYVVNANSEKLHGIKILNGNLLLRDENSTVALKEQGSLEDYPSLELLIGDGLSYDSYNRNAWVMLQGVSNSTFVDKVLAGDLCVEVMDKTNPTINFGNGYNIDKSTYSPITSLSYKTAVTGDDFVMNTYCPANFVAQDKYYMVEPIACEYAKIVWAVNTGDGNLYMVKKQHQGDGRYHNSEGLTGGFSINTAYLEPGQSFDEENAAYECECLIIKGAASSLGAPRLKGNVEADKTAVGNYTVYPVTITKKYENIITGIENVNGLTKTIASVKYYNAAGIASDTPFVGVNIVKTTYTDGSTATTKVLK